MTPNFRGCYDARIDIKGRLTLPSALRGGVPQLETDAPLQQFVVTNSLSQNRPCLDVFLLADWEKLEQRVAGLPEFHSDVIDFRRFYMASAHVVKLDRQNRLLLPQHFREFAQLGDHIMTIGMGKKFEIWSEQVWSEMHQGVSQRFDQVLAGIAGLEREAM